MLLYIIFGVLFLICTVIMIVIKFVAKDSKEPAFANFLLALCISFTALFGIAGFKLSGDAKDNYNQMLTEKVFIEQNINSDDIFNSLSAHDRYFQYQFKLEQMKRSKNDGWIASMYYFYDLEKLELNIQ